MSIDVRLSPAKKLRNTIRLGTIRATLLETMDGTLGWPELTLLVNKRHGKKTTRGNVVRTVGHIQSHVFSLRRDTGIGYGVTAKQAIVALFPAGTKRVNALRFPD